MPVRSMLCRCAFPMVMSLALLAGGCHGAGKGGASAAKSASSKAASVQDDRFPVGYEGWERLGYRLDWVGFPFAGAPRGTRSITVVPYADVVLAQDSQSTVTLLEGANGHTRWSVDLANPLTKFVGLTRDPSNDSRVYVASESELFTLGVGTGNILGREAYELVVNTPPVIEGDVAVFGTSQGQVEAHLIGRGLKSWGFQSVGAINAAPVRIGDTIAMVSQGGDVMFLTWRGNLIGRARVFAGLDNSPVTDGERLFIAGRDQSVWAFDTAGTMLWRYRTSVPLRVQPTAANGRLYCEVPGTGIVCFDGPTGAVQWTSKDASGTVIASRAGNLVAWNGQKLFLIDAKHGDVMEAVEASGVQRIVADKFEDGTLYAVSDDLSLAKIGPR